MKIHLSHIAPTGHDVVRSSIFALFMVVAGNLYQGLNYYIFKPAARPAPQSTHDLLVAVMGRVDAYQPTTTIVTFLFWALLGLALLALFQGLSHTLRRIHRLRLASSYRHQQPKPVSRLVFWKQWALTSIGSFMALTTALFIFSFFILCILPVGVVYTRIFMLSPTPFNMVYALMGICLTCIGMVLATVGVRLIVARRRLFRLA